MPRYDQMSLEELLRLAARGHGSFVSGARGGGSGYGGGFRASTSTSLPFGVTTANTAAIRTAVQGVIAGTGDAIWLSAGDSLTASGCSDTFPLGLRAEARPHYEAVAFQALLPSITVEDRTLWNLAGKTTTAAYETMVPQWNFNSGTIGAGVSIGGRNFQHAVLSGADVYTPGERLTGAGGGTFDRIRLRYTGPTTTRSIVWLASTTTGGSIVGDSVFDPKTIILDPLGNATTISFRAGGVASGVNWMSVECFNIGTKRLSVQNGGWNGSDSNDWNSVAAASGPIGMITHVAADMLLYGIGTNDIQTRTVAAMQTGVQAIITTQLATGKSMALLGLPPLDPSLYTSQAHIDTYNAGLQALAISNNIPFVPYRDVLGGTYAASLANGYSYSDGTHLTALGAQKVANDVIAPLMTAILAA